jgi:sulfite exporter TauE/SafE
VTSYIAGTGAGFSRGVKITLIFNSGRILAYVLIGGLIGLFSGLITLAAPDVISPFQVYASLVFGLVTVVIGSSILLKARRLQKCNFRGDNIVTSGKMNRFGFDFGAFSLGLTRGLIICPPLITLLVVYALPFSNPLGSITLATLFGLGTTLSPILVLGGVTGWLLNKAPLFRKLISIAGGAVLIVLGVVTIVSSMIQLP